MGDVGPTTMFVFLSILLFAWAGMTIVNSVILDEQVKAYSASAHSVALDISNLVALSGVATDRAFIDYTLEEDSLYVINANGHELTVTRCIDTKECNTEEEIKKQPHYKLSLPFDLGQFQTRGGAFRISKIRDESGNVKYSIGAGNG